MVEKKLLNSLGIFILFLIFIFLLTGCGKNLINSSSEINLQASSSMTSSQAPDASLPDVNSSSQVSSEAPVSSAAPALPSYANQQNTNTGNSSFEYSQSIINYIEGKGGLDKDVQNLIHQEGRKRLNAIFSRFNVPANVRDVATKYVEYESQDEWIDVQEAKLKYQIINAQINFNDYNLRKSQLKIQERSIDYQKEILEDQLDYFSKFTGLDDDIFDVFDDDFFSKRYFYNN